jgi:hypothetical protein
MLWKYYYKYHGNIKKQWRRRKDIKTLSEILEIS